MKLVSKLKPYLLSCFLAIPVSSVGTVGYALTNQEKIFELNERIDDLY